MADIRPKDLLPTAESMAEDDYLLLDGATEGTRKISANAAVAVAAIDATGGAAGAVPRPLSATLADSISVKDFGAVGDGVADDTAAINAAIAASDVINFPAGGIFRCDTIEVPANKILLGYGATLKLKAFNGAAGNYKSVINIVDASNIRIYGLTLDGSRKDHTNTLSLTTDEDSGMHGFRILAAKEIHLVDCTAKNCFADGIMIADDVYHGGSAKKLQSERVLAVRCLFDNNRRQGCSIISGSDFHFTECGFTNTNGTLPGYGVDLEPDNQPHQFISRVSFTRCWMTGNEKKGFGMLIPGQTVEDVTLRDCVIEGNGDQIADIWPNVNNGGTLRRFSLIGGYTDSQIRIGQSGVAADRDSKFEDCLIERVLLGQAASINVQNTLSDGFSVIIRGVVAIANAAAETIRMSDCEGILIEGCDLKGGTRSIRSRGNLTKRVTIRNNHIQGSINQAIEFAAAEDLLIDGNYITSSGSDGINLIAGSRAVISNNHIVGYKGSRIRIQHGWNHAVLGTNYLSGGVLENLLGSNIVRIATTAA